MRLQFSPWGFVLLMVGGFLIYAKIPFLDLVGIVLFFVGLLLPVLKKPQPIGGRQDEGAHPNSAVSLSQLQRETDVFPASDPKLFSACLMLGGYLKRIYDGDPLGIPVLIELSKNPDSKIRWMCCSIFRYLERYDERVMTRLQRIEQEDPEPFVRETARAARTRLVRIRSEWDIDTG